MGKVLHYIKNLIGSVGAVSVAAILYDTMFSPPEWASAGVSLLIGVVVYVYLSLSDDIKQFGVHNVE
jgi:hypothetical protein